MPSYFKKTRRKDKTAKGGGLFRIVVRARPGCKSQGLLVAGRTVFPCALGRNGISAGKREGDWATPLARMRLRSGYFRADHVPVGATRLPMRRIAPDLGWCEVPGDRNYNRPVKMPYAASHETMARPDRLYDFCIVLDWNIRPRRIGRGSAIFFHLSRPGFLPTAGCVAVTERVMRRLLPHLSRETVLEVRR